VQTNAEKMNSELYKAGAVNGIRIDNIIIEPYRYNPSTGEHIPFNFSEDLLWDGRWGFEREEWASSKINKLINQTEKELIHEWSHQIGLIDVVNIHFDANYAKNNQIIPGCSDIPQSGEIIIDNNLGNYFITDSLSFKTLSRQSNDLNKCTYYNTDLYDYMGGGDNNDYFSEFSALAIIGKVIQTRPLLMLKQIFKHKIFINFYFFQKNKKWYNKISE